VGKHLEKNHFSQAENESRVQGCENQMSRNWHREVEKREDQGHYFQISSFPHLPFLFL
jgi:hypothetical protein